MRYSSIDEAHRCIGGMCVGSLDAVLDNVVDVTAEHPRGIYPLVHLCGRLLQCAGFYGSLLEASLLIILRTHFVGQALFAWDVYYVQTDYSGAEFEMGTDFVLGHIDPLTLHAIPAGADGTTWVHDMLYCVLPEYSYFCVGLFKRSA